MTANPRDITKMYERGLQLADQSMGVGSKGSLTESQGWKEYTEGISNPQVRSFTANMLENYRKHRLSLDESTTSLQVGNFDKWAFPLISIVSENMITQELVSVQPLEGPSGHVFFLNIVTGQDKGSTPKGSKVWDARTGHADRASDSDDSVNGEVVGETSGDGSLTNVHLSYTPIIPGTVTLAADDNSVYYRDNANGVLLNGVTEVGTIDYTSGALNLTSAGSDGITLLASYNYNSELNGEAQQLEIEVQHSPVFCKERKMRIRWTMEAAQIMDAIHKANVEDILSDAVTNNINWEIDREVLEDLRRGASAGVVNWSAQAPAGSTIGYQEHKLSFVDALVQASGFISRATNRVRANWVVAGQNASNVLETLPQFEPVDADLDEIEGVCYLGKLSRMKVYSDPHFNVNEALVGYKGKDFTRSGYIYAPWLLLFSTPTITLDDFLNRKGLASSYAKKMVNSRYYAKIKMSNFTAQFGDPNP